MVVVANDDVHRHVQALEKVPDWRQLFRLPVLGQITHEQAQVDGVGQGLDLPDQALKPRSTALIQIMEIVDNDEAKLARLTGVPRLQGAWPESGGEQTRSALAKQLTTGQTSASHAFSFGGRQGGSMLRYGQKARE
jgi:hypothetical protein